jgi:hypothetical protein
VNSKQYKKQLRMVLIMETIFCGRKVSSDYIVAGVVDRDSAEKDGIRHFTTIIVPIITDGDHKGEWIVVDRTAKQWAKNKPTDYYKSYNLIGGHIKANEMSLIGKPMTDEVLLEGALEELSEELFSSQSETSGNTSVELWEDGKFTGRRENVGKYNSNELIPIGYTEFTSAQNSEYSYVYVLPVPSMDIADLVAADDYGKNLNVKLDIEILSEEQLKDMHENDKCVEICDAITRLWLPENTVVLAKLHSITL